MTFCSDLLNLYSPDMRLGIVGGLKDILSAQIQHVVRAAESKEWEASVSDDDDDDEAMMEFYLNLYYGNDHHHITKY